MPTDPTARVCVSAPSELAADAGAAIAAGGGNAVDAAVAATLVTMVNEVGIVSLSSGAFVTVQPPSGDAVTVDGWVDMPGRGLPAERLGRGVWDVHTAYGGGVTATVGPGSVAAHGSPAALADTHARWGRADWADVVAPAIAAAEGGFVLGSASRYYLEYVHDSVFGWDPLSRSALHDDAGGLVGPRSPIVLPDLARTLRLLAAEGPTVMYDGEIGHLVVEAVGAGDGPLALDDLRAYAPVLRPALRRTVGRWTLATNPPPSVGGVCVAAMLTLLGGRPHGPWTPDDLALLVRVQRAVLGARVADLDVADDLAGAAHRLLDLVTEDGLVALESPSTVHVSACDADGLACAITASSGYGSGLVAPGTGIWLNNCLGEPELNAHGLHGEPPGTRLRSNMAPTVGRTDDGAVLAIGSPGADRISTALVQVLALLAGGADLDHAVAHPRLHVRLGARTGGIDVVDHEPGLDVPDLGLPRVAYDDLSMYFGGVTAAGLDADGHLHGAADPRRTGAVRYA